MGILSEKRNGRITASAIGAILGVNPYQSADDAMRTMVRKYHGAESEFTGNDATEHGHKMESVAIADYEIDYIDGVIQDPDFAIHPTIDWLGCTPDGLIGDDGLLEVKCPYYAKKCYTLAEKPMYLYQCYLQLICTNREWLDFYVWMPNEQHCEQVSREDADIWFDESFVKIQMFYHNYLEIIEDKKLSAPYLEDKEIDLSLDTDWAVAALTYKVLRDNLEIAKQDIDAAKKTLLAIAKVHGKKCTGNGVMAYSSIRKGSVDYKRLQGDLSYNPDDYRKKDTIVWTVR